MPTTTQAVHSPQPDRPVADAEGLGAVACSLPGSPASPPPWRHRRAGPFRATCPPERRSARRCAPRSRTRSGRICSPPSAGWRGRTSRFCVVTTLAAQLRVAAATRRPPVATAPRPPPLITAVVVLGQLRSLPAPHRRPVPHHRRTPSSGARQPTLAPPAPASLRTASPVIHTVVEGDTLWGIAAPITATARGGRPSTRPTSAYRNLAAAHSATPTGSIPAGASSSPTPSPRPRADAPASQRPLRSRARTSTRRPGPGQRRLHPVAEPAPTPRSSAPEAQSLPAPAPPLAAHRLDSPGLGTGQRPPSGPPAATGSRHSPARPHEAARNPTRHAAASHDDNIGVLAIGAGIVGLGAVALVGALERRRRRQSGRRSPGRRIPLPAPRSSLAELERQLRHHARADSLFWLTRLADMLAHGADSAHARHPRSSASSSVSTASTSSSSREPATPPPRSRASPAIRTSGTCPAPPTRVSWTTPW